MIPTCKYIIDYRYLKALSILASKDGYRYILNGVAIESDKTHKYIVATDGRRLGVIQNSLTDEEESMSKTLIIPTGLIKRIVRPKHDFVTITSDGNRITITSDDSSISGKAIDGNYPSWRQVVPTGTPTAPSRMAFGGELMRGFFDVEKVLGNPRSRGLAVEQIEEGFKQEGGFIPSPFLIRLANIPEFFGVLMPMAPNRAFSEFIPSWAKPAK